jgi:hypothetical protein
MIPRRVVRRELDPYWQQDDGSEGSVTQLHDHPPPPLFSRVPNSTTLLRPNQRATPKTEAMHQLPFALQSFAQTRGPFLRQSKPIGKLNNNTKVNWLPVCLGQLLASHAARMQPSIVDQLRTRWPAVAHRLCRSEGGGPGGEAWIMTLNPLRLGQEHDSSETPAGAVSWPDPSVSPLGEKGTATTSTMALKFYGPRLLMKI